MDEKIYTVELTDGTIIGNLAMNGNNLVSKEEITRDMFDGNCKNVTITAEGYERVIVNGKLGFIQKIGDEWFFDIWETPITEKLYGDIEYIAMMADIELED